MSHGVPCKVLIDLPGARCPVSGLPQRPDRPAALGYRRLFTDTAAP